MLFDANNNEVEMTTIMNAFNPENHPDCVEGNITSEEILQEFEDYVNTFDFLKVNIILRLLNLEVE